MACVNYRGRVSCNTAIEQVVYEAKTDLVALMPDVLTYVVAISVVVLLIAMIRRMTREGYRCAG